MAINFNQNSSWDLKPITPREVDHDVADLLLEDEKICAAFKTIRDQLIFTTKRIIAIDVQGLTGKRKSFTSMPYSKVQFFSVQTPYAIEIVKDSELELTFANGFVAK
ncbi:MAG: PH domain-containing protein, partial [Lachnospiraceae bacterium]|nr:PH domain-containing protein [Lachnospiraceae bacterium]